MMLCSVILEIIGGSSWKLNWLRYRNGCGWRRLDLFGELWGRLMSRIERRFDRCDDDDELSEHFFAISDDVTFAPEKQMKS